MSRDQTTTHNAARVTDPDRAFNRGYRDYDAGKPVSTPPYADREMAKQWELGYEKARSEKNLNLRLDG